MTNDLIPLLLPIDETGILTLTLAKDFYFLTMRDADERERRKRNPL